ncbi:MAG: hypothetical protein NVS9B12_00390 [Vulcanimicrobiaceae bacterium]
MWVLDPLGNRVDVFQPNEEPRSFDLPSAFAGAQDIVATKTAVWIFEASVNKLARFTPEGNVVEFPMVDRVLWRDRMTVGPDGNIWIDTNDAIEVYDHNGRSERIKTAPLGYVHSISTGSAGNVWIADGDTVATIDSHRKLTLFHGFSKILAISAANHGAWIIQSNALTYIAQDGKTVKISLTVDEFTPRYEAVDRDDTLWFTDRFGNIIASAKTDGTLRAAYIDVVPTGVSGIAIGPSGTAWYSAPREHLIFEYRKRIVFAPAKVDASYLAFDSIGNLWYTAPDADVVGYIPPAGKSQCFALRYATVRSCQTSEAIEIAP